MEEGLRDEVPFCFMKNVFSLCASQCLYYLRRGN